MNKIGALTGSYFVFRTIIKKNHNGFTQLY